MTTASAHIDELPILMPSTTPTAAFAELYERHYEAVFRAALRVTGNAADAEDVQGCAVGMQEPGHVMVRLQKQAGRVGEGLVVHEQPWVDVTVRRDDRQPAHLLIQPAGDVAQPGAGVCRGVGSGHEPDPGEDEGEDPVVLKDRPAVVPQAGRIGVRLDLLGQLPEAGGRLVEIGDQVAASGGPPTPEQGAQMAHLGAEIKRHGQIDLVLLFLAVAAMATARYW